MKDSDYGSISTEEISTNEKKQPKPQYSVVTLAAIAGIAALGLVMAIESGVLKFPMAPKESDVSALIVKAKTSWTLWRTGYDPLNYFTPDASDFLEYKFLAKYDGVIEPLAPMNLYVDGFTTKTKEYYTFEVCPEDGDGSGCKSGSLKVNGKKIMYVSVKFSCDPFDKFTVTMRKYTSTDEIKEEFTGRAMCMYVRREIRSLEEGSLNATMNAMYALWSTSDEEGQKMYGSDFHNITYLLEMHHFNAAWPDADHFHEGNGFVAQHIKMTNIFEKMIQMVDPSVTVPYWDFTMETTEGKYIFQSPVMSANVFGSMKTPTDDDYEDGYTYATDLIEDFAIKDGRWAYTLAEFNPDKFSELEAGYGYMRSPWNMNPSKYLSRFSGTSFLPKCSTHGDMLQCTDMMKFFINIEVAPHASVHGASGGTYGCDMFQPLLDAEVITSKTAMQQICKLWIFTLKGLYRTNLIKAQTGCTVPEDVQSASCPFECLSDDAEGLKDALFANIVNGDIPSRMSEAQEQVWVDFICGGNASRVFSGDHAESASPSDPSFWPIHPTLERLFQAKLMAGGFESDDWASDPATEAVCTRSTCYEDGSYDTWDSCCYGHFEKSKMLDFESGDKDKFVGDTNGVTIKATDPTSQSYSVPYIYDSFSWDHCEDLGPESDLNEILETKYVEYSSRRRHRR